MNIGDDIIDSRDVIARIEELESERESLLEDIENARETLADFEDDTSVIDADERADKRNKLASAISELEAFDNADEDGAGELATLKQFASELEGYGDWSHGEALIEDNYFEEYAEQLARDIYDLPDHWPVCHIDWMTAADALKADYTSAGIDDYTYWMRA